MSKSSTMIKFIVVLIINIGFFLNESEATKLRRPIHGGPTPSPLPSPRNHTLTTLAHSPQEKLTPQYKHFLEECEKRMTEKCSEEIFQDIFQNKTITKKCCYKLVDMGPDCHRVMIQREKDLIKSKKERNTIVSRSENLWKRCLKVTPVKKNRHYPKVPPRQYLPGYEKFLQECENKMTDKCGNEVMEVVLEKKRKNVDKGCCSKLMTMGYDCHQEMLLRLEHLATKISDKSGVKKRGHQMWKHCEKITGHHK
ncbi:hypothetical protein ABFS83_11G116900 [Erythranthe nasuta]